MTGTGPFMAFDPGTKRIGVAVSDAGGRVATPVTTVTVSSRKKALEQIRGLVEEYRPGELIVGLPLNLDGSRGRSAGRSEAFAASLEELTGLKVTLWDERLTTLQAERALLEFDLSRRKRRRVVDRVAAVLLLQGYLDHRGANR